MILNYFLESWNRVKIEKYSFPSEHKFILNLACELKVASADKITTLFRASVKFFKPNDTRVKSVTPMLSLFHNILYKIKPLFDFHKWQSFCFVPKGTLVFEKIGNFKKSAEGNTDFDIETSPRNLSVEQTKGLCSCLF